jgi:hypothetical protein
VLAVSLHRVWDCQAQDLYLPLELQGSLLHRHRCHNHRSLERFRLVAHHHEKLHHQRRVSFLHMVPHHNHNHLEVQSPLRLGLHHHHPETLLPPPGPTSAPLHFPHPPTSPALNIPPPASPPRAQPPLPPTLNTSPPPPPSSPPPHEERSQERRQRAGRGVVRGVARNRVIGDTGETRGNRPARGEGGRGPSTIRNDLTRGAGGKGRGRGVREGKPAWR